MLPYYLFLLVQCWQSQTQVFTVRYCLKYLPLTLPTLYVGNIYRLPVNNDSLLHLITCDQNLIVFDHFLCGLFNVLMSSSEARPALSIPHFHLNFVAVTPFITPNYHIPFITIMSILTYDIEGLFCVNRCHFQRMREKS